MNIIPVHDGFLLEIEQIGGIVAEALRP